MRGQFTERPAVEHSADAALGWRGRRDREPRTVGQQLLGADHF
jgi:hypothetical protein